MCRILPFQGNHRVYSGIYLKYFIFRDKKFQILKKYLMNVLAQFFWASSQICAKWHMHSHPPGQKRAKTRLY